LETFEKKKAPGSPTQKKKHLPSKRAAGGRIINAGRIKKKNKKVLEREDSGDGKK